jgi:chromosome segregation ATPase
MNIDKDIGKQIDRMFPEAPPPDATALAQTHMTNVRVQMSDAERHYSEIAKAIERCDVDINAPRDVEHQIAELTAKRTDALAQGYLRNLVSGTSTKKLDAEIATLQTTLTELKTRAEGAAAARRVLLPKLVEARQTLDELQETVSLTSLQTAGRVLTSGELDLLDQHRRRQQATAVNTTDRTAEELRSQRDTAEAERQRRQNGGVDPGPLPKHLR